jgi:hypothetical protein
LLNPPRALAASAVTMPILTSIHVAISFALT